MELWEKTKQKIQRKEQFWEMTHSVSKYQGQGGGEWLTENWLSPDHEVTLRLGYMAAKTREWTRSSTEYFKGQSQG